MKNYFYALTCTILVTLACGTGNITPAIAPTSDPNMMQTVIASTALAAQTQTQAAYVPVDNLQLTDTMVPTNAPLVTETPLVPVTLTYEGLSASCICTACSCLTNITFTVRVTIDSQGYITGVLEKYTPDSPAIQIEGTQTNIRGLFQDENGKTEFVGSFSENFSTLEATLSFEGKIPMKAFILEKEQ